MTLVPCIAPDLATVIAALLGLLVGISLGRLGPRPKPCPKCGAYVEQRPTWVSEEFEGHLELTCTRCGYKRMKP